MRCSNNHLRPTDPETGPSLFKLVNIFSLEDSQLLSGTLRSHPSNLGVALSRRVGPLLTHQGVGAS
jgi:hypothetical protein